MTYKIIIIDEYSNNIEVSNLLTDPDLSITYESSWKGSIYFEDQIDYDHAKKIFNQNNIKFIS